jgi:tryptophan 2,3-dioxygenase
MQERICQAPDALFFIAVHQVTELWFMVILHELDLARSAIDADDLREARYRLVRVRRIEDVLARQLPALETIGPVQFDEIRRHLGTSSGLQSAQFREIEFLSGLKDESYLKFADVTVAERARLMRRLREPSLWDAFCGLLQRRGQADLLDVLRANNDPPLLDLMENLLDHDEGFARWRALHSIMVERVIGHKPGTGGSSGVDYLRSRLAHRFFPELWWLRTAL